MADTGKLLSKPTLIIKTKGFYLLMLAIRCMVPWFSLPETGFSTVGLFGHSAFHGLLIRAALFAFETNCCC